MTPAQTLMPIATMAAGYCLAQAADSTKNGDTRFLWGIGAAIALIACFLLTLPVR